jgi:hypothetical protein
MPKPPVAGRIERKVLVFRSISGVIWPGQIPDDPSDDFWVFGSDDLISVLAR